MKDIHSIMKSPINLAKRYLTLNSNRILTMPILILMPHSSCNCRCIMCDIWQANQDKRELSPKDLERHLSIFKKLDVKWVVLSGGEALMHSNLWTLCQMLEELKIKITLISTGLLLKREAGNVVKYCDEVIVSLDGSPTIHNQIRNIPRAYEKMADGIKVLREFKHDFYVGARCVIQKENFLDIPNIIDTAHTLQLNQISFLAADVSSTAFNREQIWQSDRVADIALSSQETAQFSDLLEKVIDAYANDFSTGFIAENPHKLRRILHYYAALNDEASFPETSCNAPWVSVVIEADGVVRPCFFLPKMGNIKENNLDEILNSSGSIAFRKQLDVKTDPVCQKCVCTLNLSATSL